MSLLKKILILTETVYHLINKKKMFNRLAEEKSHEFQNLKEKRGNCNNLLYK